MRDEFERNISEKMDTPTEFYTVTTNRPTGILWTPFKYMLYVKLRIIHKGKRLDEKGSQ